MENKTYTYIFNDILGKVLQLSENPSQFAEYLTQQISELIGVRTIVIAIKTEAEQSKIFSVFPVRRTDWANQPLVLQLAEHSFNLETIQYLDNVTCEQNVALLLNRLEIEKVIAIPLIAANRKVGSILLLDIMDLFGIGSMIDLLTRLSGVFALVIRNSHLYQNMENLVEIRTNELQKRNDELLEREKQLEFANKEYKQLNQELFEAKEHAEESDRLKSAFLANMSHEIRTPMNGILGFAELLKEPDLSGEEQQKYIRIIEKSGVRMLNIINDIVDISKIESGQMKISVSKTNVNDQIEFLHKFFQTEAEKKGLRLFSKTPQLSKDSILHTDREKLYAILTNLIKNAIKYTDKGTVEFGYDLVETRLIASIQFYVRDTGIGIPKKRQEAIFERFIQADILDKMARQGAGLGLAISRAYVEMLGGTIWVESEEGKGSTFYFTIPYQTGTKEEKVLKNEIASVAEETQKDKLKILIVEDDEFSRQLISIEVRKFAKEIIQVQTGTEAVEASRNNSDIDLVLMDIQMPEMDGYEATRQIRQFNTKVIIIAQTAYGLSGDREKTIDSGCNDYISKPIQKVKLMEIIQRHLMVCK